jgi:hypothetical protein
MTLDAICNLWQYKSTIMHYNRVQYSATLFSFHCLFRRLHGISGCKNTTSMLTNKTYSGMKPPIAQQGRSWVVTWSQ